MKGDTVNSGPEHSHVVARCLKAAYPIDPTPCFASLIAALDALESPAAHAPTTRPRKWFGWLSQFAAKA